MPQPRLPRSCHPASPVTGARALAWLLLSLFVIGGLAGCKSMVWDPTKGVSSSRGHVIDSEQPWVPAGGALGDDEGVDVVDPVPTADSARAGTGTFVRRISPPSVDTTAGDVTLNFDGQDIREVVKVILGELLGLSYVIDPAVTGAASLSTGRPLRRDLLIPTLETLLRMNGAALVDQGGRYEVVPAANAVQGRLLPQLGESARALPEGYSLQVVPLRYIGAEEMANILQPLAPEGAVVRVDTLRNLVILAGNSPEMGNLLETIAMFDVDWMAGLSVGLFTLEYAKAADVVTQLETLLADEGGGSPLKGLFRFIPMQTANALLVVSPQQSYLDQMGDWVRRIDQAEASGGTAMRLFVYRVRHGDAEELAGMLSDLFGGSGGGGQRSVGGVAPGLKQATLGSAGVGGDGAGATDPQSVATTLDMSSNVNVVADKVNNSLLVRSSPRDYKKLLDALKQLDIAPLQVLIEATIVEVSLVGELKYGVQWRFFGPAGKSYRGDTSLRGDNDGPARTFPGFNWSIVLRPDTIRATLSALASDNLINVLSSPSVMVLNNQEANIEVGEEVAVISSQGYGNNSSSGGGINQNNRLDNGLDNNVFNNNTFDTNGFNSNNGGTQNPTNQTFVNTGLVTQYQYKQTGVLLTVTPRVTPGGMVQMEIKQTVSTVADERGIGGQPSFRNRKINSTVAVRSNQAVVLGGLIQDSSQSGKSGVPGLYRAPIFGPLFGETKRNAARNELVVVLTPRVIASDSDIETVTNDFRRKVKNLDTRF